MKPFDKLKIKLSELFQLDQADLDFGIYRIMNARREEIVKFLDKELLPQIQVAFLQYKAELRQELEKAVKGAEALGMDPDRVPKVKELQLLYDSSVIDITALENEVYDHLYSFFNRYYDEGDFISLRRYKEGVYAIPYEGEEVKLHWANHDQYYIKTTENFRDYAFKLPSGKRVHFKIVEADTEKDNVKAANGKDRRFILQNENPIREENGELVIRFAYLPDPEKRKQDDLNRETITIVLATKGIDPSWVNALSQTWYRSGGSQSNKTVLERHLYDYTRRNTFDYFIHKDLGKFLRQELDFYIKNEVMHLDDVENESVPRVEQYLSKIKIIRRIAHKIIEFLAQIEDFQKKLWLKKKFVIDTNYCVTLDRVPESLYPEIAKNDAQREEWVKLFAIDEIQTDLAGQVAYSAPLTVEFLKANPYLAIDTKFFEQGFKDKLLASFENLDEQVNGVTVHGDNYHALELMRSGYKNGVNCIYIDPPFNTAASEILYKNNYKHASWNSMINDRVKIAVPLMCNEAIICAAIDDFEITALTNCLASTFGEERRLATVIVRSNPHGRAMASGFSPNHEYALFFAKSDQSIVGRIPRDTKRLARYPESDKNGIFAWMNFRATGANSRRIDRLKLYYPIFVSKSGEIRISAMSWSEINQQWDALESARTDETIVLPIDSEKSDRVWNLGWERAREEAHINLSAKLIDGEWQIYRKYRPHQDGALPGTWWEDAKYSATESGTRIIKDLFGERESFSYPKSVFLVEDCLRAANCFQKACVLDFFGGSGTTGHAVINLNREDGGSRKYILVEMGDYFDTVLKPRIQKVVYAQDWKDGKPVSRNTGVSHMFKYIRLESYEDALANLQFRRTRAQQSLLDKSASFRESYMLAYMLDTETKGSPSRLNIDRFDDPFSYKLLIGAGSVGETRPVNVDLVETFNWLLGLKVKNIDCIEEFRIVEGTNPKGEKALVIWRKIRDLGETDPEKIRVARERANETLETFFRKQQYNTMDMEFDVIYVNGDNNLMNIPMAPEGEGQEPCYKVRLIEEEFQRLMFDVQDI